MGTLPAVDTDRTARGPRQRNNVPLRIVIRREPRDQATRRLSALSK